MDRDLVAEVRRVRPGDDDVLRPAEIERGATIGQDGESLLAGLRRRSLGRFADHPNGQSAHFRRVLSGSPLLQAKGQQMWAWHEDAVADALAAEVDELTARILAHQIFNIHPLALRMVERWTEEGLEADEIRERVLALLNRAFDLLDRSVAVGGAV